MAVAVLQRDFYEERLLKQADELKKGREDILEELSNTSKREKDLKRSNERITNIMTRLLEEKSERSNRR